jgi:hypothetical protein
LLPYLDDYWREHVIRRGIDGDNFETSSYPSDVPLNYRPDWRRAKDAPETGGEAVRDQLLRPFQSQFAIRNMLHGAPIVFNEDLSAALCRAVTEGVFIKFPGLKVVLIESGVTWLPAYLWRINKTWRGVRAETPWVDRLPSEIIREHVRLTIQPFDEPPKQSQIQTILEEIGSGEMLLFDRLPALAFRGNRCNPGGTTQRLELILDVVH